MNIVAILVAVFVSFIFGFIWHANKVFGKTWRKAVNLSQEKMEKNKNGNMTAQMVLHIIFSIIAIVALKYIIGIVSIGPYAIASVIWIGAVIPIIIGNIIWEGKKWSLLWVSGLYHLFNFYLIIYVLQIFKVV